MDYSSTSNVETVKDLKINVTNAANELEQKDSGVEDNHLLSKHLTPKYKVHKTSDSPDILCKQIENDTNVSLTINSDENDTILFKNKRSRKQIINVQNNIDDDLIEFHNKNVNGKSIKNQLNKYSIDCSNKLRKSSELAIELNKTIENSNILEKLNIDEINTNNNVKYHDKFSTTKNIIEHQKSETEDFETIDKIADMIANTENVKIIPNEFYQDEIVKNMENIKNSVQVSQKPSFEEVETKLEEMFAGIEDERVPDVGQSVSICKNSKNLNKEECASHKNILFNIVPNEIVNQNEETSQKRIYSGKIYRNKKKRKIVKKTNEQKIIKPLENNKSKSKNIKEETILTDKYKGPFIQLYSEGVFSVVNTPLTEEESEKRINNKKLTLNYTKREKNKILGLHVSTLSNKYDADTTDKSWLCFFCKKGPHRGEQGDLFGPYIVNTNCEEFRMLQNHFQNVPQMQEGTDIQNKETNNLPLLLSNNLQTDNKQFKKTLIDEVPKPNIEIFSGMVKISDTSYEVWIHEDCIVWASGTYLIGSKIIGLDSAVWRSTTNICSICSRNGAIVCCLQRECQEISHIACARSEKWSISEKDFKSYCKAHTFLT